MIRVGFKWRSMPSSRAITAASRGRFVRRSWGSRHFETDPAKRREQVERILRGDEVPPELRREPEPELSDEEIFWDL